MFQYYIQSFFSANFEQCKRSYSSWRVSYAMKHYSFKEGRECLAVKASRRLGYCNRLRTRRKHSVMSSRDYKNEVETTFMNAEADTIPDYVNAVAKALCDCCVEDNCYYNKRKPIPEKTGLTYNNNYEGKIDPFTGKVKRPNHQSSVKEPLFGNKNSASSDTKGKATGKEVKKPYRQSSVSSDMIPLLPKDD